MNRSLFTLAAVIVLWSVIGCSGSSNNPIAGNPGLPDLTGSMENQTAQAQMNPGHSLLGYYDVLFDPETMQLEFVPLRTSQFHLNLTPVLEGSSPPNVFLVGSITFVNGILSVGVGIKHPYAGATALSGFDVKGILITKGSETGFGDPQIRIAGPNETRLHNADGFTRWWNPAEFMGSGTLGYTPGKLGTVINPANAAILNGYKLFADGFGGNQNLGELNTNLRALFSAGSSNVRTYEISLASGLKFNYAIDASWAPPTVKPPVNLPGDFPIEANQVEPWFLQVIETNNTLWYEGGDHGGNVSYILKVYDWQGVEGIDTVHFESPGLFNFTATDPDVIEDTYYQYEFDVILPELTSNTDLDVLVTVEVEGDYNQSLTGVTAPLRAYHRHITVVSDENPIFNIPPVSLMEATSATDILIGESISWDGSASYDPDGIVEEYRWDFNADGVYGDSYDSGTAAAPTKIFNTAGTFNVRLRVVDDKGSTNTSAPVLIHVTLDTNILPVANAVVTTPTPIDEDSDVSFDATGSNDPDGSITEYQWDFDGDGIFGDPYTGAPETPTYFYADPGTYFVDLKVIDNEAGTDKLDQKIELVINDVPNIPPTAVAIATTSVDIANCESISFDATGSTDADGTVDYYEWDFDGDGMYGDPYDSGTDEQPTKVYNVGGSIDVQLRVYDNEGGTDILDEPIQITVENHPPTAHAVITTTDTIYQGDTITFNATGSTDPDASCGDEIVSYEWDFDGDGTYGDPWDLDEEWAPVKLFPVAGTYYVDVKVTDMSGDWDTLDVPIPVYILNKNPIACVEIDQDWPHFWNEELTFNGGCSSDPDGTVELYEWDLGADGSFEYTGETFSTSFAVADIYLLQLRVTDNQGGVDMLSDPFEFQIYDDTNYAPIINEVTHSRTTSEKGNVNEAVQLDVDFWDPFPGGETHTFLWTCDYGTFSNQTIQNPIWYPPNQVIKCDITVRVTDEGLLYSEGTVRQWVTQWPVRTGNPDSPTGEDIISHPMKAAFGLGLINPASFTAANFGGNGNVIYVNHWATWCGPCVAEMPSLTVLYQTYMDEDYVHIMSDNNETLAQVETFVTNGGYEASYWLLDTGSVWFSMNMGWADPPGFIPTHFVFDRDGKCRAQNVGSLSSIATMTQYIDQLI